jgi:hypothetical protein
MLKSFKNETEKKEYFFALEVNIERIKSALWTIEGEQTRLVSLGETQIWSQDKESFLTCVDACLSSAIEKFSPQEELVEPRKIIFGLSNDWIEENKILPEKVELLKKVTEKLELTALGFMVIPEAIVHWLKKLEGVPPTVILVGLNEKKISVSLVELGKVIGTSLVVRSESLGADLMEGLSRLEKEAPFPPRILLYDGSDKLEQARQDLIDWPWSEGKINFFHLPKVEILEDSFDIKAIVFASASQMAGVQSLEVTTETEKPEEKEKQEDKQEENQEDLTLPEEVPTDLLGFIKGKDIKEIEPQVVEEKSKEESWQKEAKPKEWLKSDKKWFSLKPKIFAFSWFKKIDFGIKVIKKREFSFSKGRRILILSLVSFLMIVGGLGAVYWYVPSASIVIFAQPQILEKDFTVKLDPNLTTPDKENLILPAKRKETFVEGEKEISTTGTKIIGDKAKGEITIYNRTSKEKTFPEGTELIGPDNLKFTLDSKTTVASASAGPDYVIVPGKTVATITAEAIGSESNLASGTEFNIGNFSRSDFIARNEAALTGGTSREIQVVAKKDQEKVLLDLQKELQQKAKDDLSSQLSSTEKIVDDSLISEVVEKEFDKKVDEEADTLKLRLKLKVEALIFSESDFKQLVEEKIRKLVPADFEYDSEQTETNFQLQESSPKIITFKASFKAKLIPKFNLEEIKNNLAGKKTMIGQTYLGNLPNVDSFEAKISPKFPEQIATFPRVAKRIKIEVKLK